jgi:hypothetical protein
MEQIQNYRDAMNVQSAEEAASVLESLTQRALREEPTLNYGEAKAIQLCNIGYHTGYLASRDQARRILALFGTEHPIFGKYDQEITPEKAFHAGLTLGRITSEGHLTDAAIAAARKVIEEP